MPKALDNTNIADAKAKTSDLKVWGNGDAWQLICKASSESEGWMKSTKAMRVSDLGCLVQVTTEKRNSNGSTSLAEAVTFVPRATVEPVLRHDGVLIGRRLVVQDFEA